MYKATVHFEMNPFNTGSYFLNAFIYFIHLVFMEDLEWFQYLGTRPFAAIIENSDYTSSSVIQISLCKS